MTPPRLLGVLLCYNDGDFLPDAIEHLLANHHQIVAWDHGSTDDTAAVLDRYGAHLLERTFVPRELDFYGLYPAMADHLQRHYVERFDWISWPDQDELLEGPTRDRSYWQHVVTVLDSAYDWVQFHNLNFWHTAADDAAIPSPAARVRHYAIFPDCAPRIRGWRARATNRREFNHNPPLGERYPEMFKLRHFPMRSAAQMERRLALDRANLMRGTANYHYENLKQRRAQLTIAPDQLHRDDGRTELSVEPRFDWRSIYGYGPPAPSEAT